jgi:dihydrodipicolinate synthase/N-acetylneuraminate lyase
MDAAVREVLRRGTVLPACPLALTARRKLDERRQRALCRYYAAAGAGGLAVGVHTTQFAIRQPAVGLFEPALALVAEELDRLDAGRAEPLVRVAGVCGPTTQAIAEAELARRLGYHAGLVSLSALRGAEDDAVVTHCRAVAAALPLFGFYLQPAVGGRVLSVDFWRRFLEIDNVVAIKVAPFDRYRTLDVLRAVAESGRRDVAVYTGNDDHIMLDLLTPHRLAGPGGTPTQVRIVGGLLGQWAVWTRRAVELFNRCRELAESGAAVPAELLAVAAQWTDANGAIFDAAGGFRGCIPGIHEVLRRQRLLEGTWCLDPAETLSPGQREEIDRVCRAYPHLADDEFVAAHRDAWLRP